MRQFLRSHPKAVVAVDNAGVPKASLMLYCVGDDLTFYFGTTASSGKYQALLKNPKVSVVVVDGTPDPLRSVEAQGEVTFIPKEKTAETLKMLESKNSAKFYVKDAPDFVMFSLKPSSLKWLDATGGELKIEELIK